MTLEQRIKDLATAVGTDIKDIRTSLQSLGGTSGVPALKKLLVYYGYPISFKGIYTNQGVIDEIGNNYKYWVVGDGLGNAAHEEYVSTVEIVTGVRAKGVKVYGYVPIGQSTSNLTMAQIQARIDEWTVVGVDGIFLDEFGFDYQNTRTRQVDAVNYVKSKGLPYCANAWTVEDFAIDDIANVPWPTNDWRYVNFQTYNPTNMVLPRASIDSYMFENFGFSHEGLANVFDMQERALNVQALATSKNFSVWALAVFGENPAGTLDKTKIGTFKDVDQCGAYITANAYLFDFNIVGAGGFSFGAGGTPIEAPLYNLPSTAKPATSVAVNNYVYGTSVRYFGPVRLEVVNKTFEQYINIESVTQATLEDLNPSYPIREITTADKNAVDGYVPINKAGLTDATTSGGVYSSLYGALFDRPISVSGTITLISSGSNNRRVHEVDEFEGFEVASAILDNCVHYKQSYTASWQLWTTTRSINEFRPLNPRIHNKSKAILPSHGATTASSALCVMADINAASINFTIVDHPNLVVRWSDCAYNNGYYVFVGTNGNVTITRDFVTFTNATIGGSVETYDCRAIVYCSIRKQFIILSSINTGAKVATANTDYRNTFLSISEVNGVITPTFTEKPVSGVIGSVIGRLLFTINPNNGGAVAGIVDSDTNMFGNRLFVFFIASDTLNSTISGTFSASSLLTPAVFGNWRPRYVAAINGIFIGWKAAPDLVVRNFGTPFYSFHGGSFCNYRSYHTSSSTSVLLDYVFGLDHSLIKYTSAGTNCRSVKSKISDVKGTSEYTNIPGINGRQFSNARSIASDPGTSFDLSNSANVDFAPNIISTQIGYGQYSFSQDSKSESNIANILQSDTGSVFYGTTGMSSYAAFGGTDTGLRKGKVYFEFKITSGTPDSSVSVSVVTPGYAINKCPLWDNETTITEAIQSSIVGGMFFPYNGGVKTLYGSIGTSTTLADAVFSSNSDVFGIAVDFNTSKFWIRKNNGFWNNNSTNSPEKGSGGFPLNPNNIKNYFVVMTTSKVALTIQYAFRNDMVQYAAPRGFGVWMKRNVGNSNLTPDDTIISPSDFVEGQLMVVKDGVLKLAHPADLGGKNTYNLNLDENGIFTTVEVRHKTGTLYSRSVLSGGTSPQYSTRTETFYANDGTTVLFTQVYTLSYTNGRLVSEVLQ